MRRAWALALFAVACDSTASEPELVFALPPDASWAPRAPAPPTPVGDLVLVTNNFDDSLSYVDLGLTPPRVIATVPVGLNPVEREGPHHLTLAPDGQTLWFGLSNFVPNSGSGPHGAHGAGTADGYAVPLEVATGRQGAAVRVDRNPGDIRMTPDGAKVLLTHFDLLRITEATPGTPAEALASRLAVIDRASGTREALIPVCPAAHGMVVAPDSSRVTIACWDDRIAVVDLDTQGVDLVTVLPIPGTIAEPECQPYALTQSPDGATVWVGCFASGELRAYDATRGAMDPARKLDLGGAALFGAYLAPHMLVVPSQGPDRLTWINAADAAELAHLDLDPADCTLPHAVQPTPDGGALLLVCEGDRKSPGTLVVIDAETRAVRHAVPLGRFPDDLAILPKGAP